MDSSDIAGICRACISIFQPRVRRHSSEDTSQPILFQPYQNAVGTLRQKGGSVLIHQRYLHDRNRYLGRYGDLLDSLPSKESVTCFPVLASSNQPDNVMFIDGISLESVGTNAAFRRVGMFEIEAFLSTNAPDLMRDAKNLLFLDDSDTAERENWFRERLSIE